MLFGNMPAHETFSAGSIFSPKNISATEANYTAKHPHSVREGYPRLWSFSKVGGTTF